MSKWDKLEFVCILRDKTTGKYKRYEAETPDKFPIGKARKIIDGYNKSHENDVYTISFDKDLVDMVAHQESVQIKYPEQEYMEEQIEKIDDVINDLEWEKDKLRTLQEKKAEQMKKKK